MKAVHEDMSEDPAEMPEIPSTIPFLPHLVTLFPKMKSQLGMLLIGKTFS